MGVYCVILVFENLIALLYDDPILQHMRNLSLFEDEPSPHLIIPPKMWFYFGGIQQIVYANKYFFVVAVGTCVSKNFYLV